MSIKQVQLKTYPKSLPDDVEVRDFDLGNGRFARVRMEIRQEVQNQVPHFVLYAKAFEMSKAGQFIQAPQGNPSGSDTTSHTVIASAIGKTINIDDSWVEFPVNFAPGGGVATTAEGEYVSRLKEVKLKPTAPGESYEDVVYVLSEQKCYRWTEGFADIVARTKVEDLLNVLKTSDIRAGVGFRNRRNQVQE